MSLSDFSVKLTESSLDEVIRKIGGVRHTKYSFDGSSGNKGDSYLSTVGKLKVEGVDADGGHKEINLLLKGMPKNMSRRKLFRSTDFFRNEIHFYEKVIPAFEDFQRSRGAQNPFVEYPRCLLSLTDGVNDFVALENVNFLGYFPPNRQSYITLTDCLLIMKSLGRFHGVSIAFNHLQPERFQEVAKSVEEVYYCERLRPWYTKFLDSAMVVAKDAVAKAYPATKYQELTDKFLNANLYDDMISMVSTKTKYSVIGHGDCWSPNFLTKFDEEKNPIAITIIDFQLSRYASFALDFTFFLYSCTSQELREKHFDEILESYYRSAADLIADLGCDPEKVFPLSGVKAELKQFGRFGCGMGIESLPMSMMEDDEVADLDAITGSDPELTDVWKIYPFKEEEKWRRIAECLKHAIDSGFLS